MCNGAGGRVGGRQDFQRLHNALGVSLKEEKTFGGKEVGLAGSLGEAADVAEDADEGFLVVIKGLFLWISSA